MTWRNETYGWKAEGKGNAVFKENGVLRSEAKCH